MWIYCGSVKDMNLKLCMGAADDILYKQELAITCSIAHAWNGINVNSLHIISTPTECANVNKDVNS